MQSQQFVLHGLPGVPSVPGVVGVPSVCGVPNIPSVPVLPGVPSNSSVHVPNVLGVPNIPNVPGVQIQMFLCSRVPSVPSVPNLLCTGSPHPDDFENIICMCMLNRRCYFTCSIVLIQPCQLS